MVSAAWTLWVAVGGVERSESPPDAQEMGRPVAAVSAVKVTVAPARSELFTPVGELMVTFNASAGA